jgi:hypothetical protein
MKIFRLILVIGIAVTISFFSWSFYTSKSLRDKYERAKLVLQESSGMTNITEWRDYNVYT